MEKDIEQPQRQSASGETDRKPSAAVHPVFEKLLDGFSGKHTATSNPVVALRPSPESIAVIVDAVKEVMRPTRRQFDEPGECAYCERERAKQKDGAIPFFPPHDASNRCESGKHNHCSCDTCF